MNQPEDIDLYQQNSFYGLHIFKVIIPGFYSVHTILKVYNTTDCCNRIENNTIYIYGFIWLLILWKKKNYYLKKLTDNKELLREEVTVKLLGA